MRRDAEAVRGALAATLAADERRSNADAVAAKHAGKRALRVWRGPWSFGPLVHSSVHSLVHSSIHRSIHWSIRPFIGPFVRFVVHSYAHTKPGGCI